MLMAAFAVGAALPGAIRRARAACDCGVDAWYQLVDVQKVSGDGDLEAERARYKDAPNLLVRFVLTEDERAIYDAHESETDEVLFRMAK